MIVDDKLYARLQVLNVNPEAVRFIKAYIEYCHDIDDIIDNAITDPEFILKTFLKAAAIFSSNFYVKHSEQLYPLIIVITNSYADSVQFERSKEGWKLQASDVLRHCAIDMVLLVVGIVAGYDAVREISPLLREHNYNQHHDAEGKPI